MQKIVLFLAGLVLITRSVAQPLQIGQWKDQLCYKNAYGVTASDNKIYCVTELSMFSVDKSDHSLQTYSTVNGLSDIETNHVAFDKIHQLLIVTYKNSNIDILQNGQ